MGEILVVISVFSSLIMSATWEIPVMCTLVPMFLAGMFASGNCYKFSSDRVNLYMLIYISITLFMIYEVKAHNISLMGLDWYGFSERAQTNLNSGLFSFALLFSNVTSDLFAKMVSMVYQIFGVYPKMINCYVFMASQILLSVFFSVCELFCDEDDDIDGMVLLLAMTPVFIIHSIAFLREIPIALFFVVSLKYYLQFLYSGVTSKLFIAVINAIIASIMHGGMVVVVFVYLVSLVFYNPSSKRVTVRPIQIIVVAVAFIAIFSTPVGYQMLTKFEVDNDILQTISNHITRDATTSYISEAPHSKIAMIGQTPIRTALFELVPLPWMIRDFSTGISWVLDGAVRIIIVYWIVRLILSIRRIEMPTEKKVFLFALLFIWVGFGVLCGWGTTTYGTAIRHRVKILPEEIILAYFSYTYIKKDSSYD